MARWPGNVPLAALLSGGERASRWSRWSVLAPLTGPVLDLAEHADIPRALRSVSAQGAHDAGRDPDAPVFVGGWVGWIGYDAGVAFEPTARWAHKTPAPGSGRGWLARCDGAYVYDRLTDRWFGCGVDGGAVDALPRIGEHADRDLGFVVDGLASVQGQAAYERAVARAVEYVHAGDIFQANIAHQMRCGFEGSSRGAFLRMHAVAQPWFGALLEDWRSRTRRTIASISPELFLETDFATGDIVTRPIKGTRDAGEASSAESLAMSGKDSAELAMIVDLMRNDLSRVCEVGSVRVERDREIERHASGAGSTGVYHGVATVRGTLREGAGFAEVLAASFPPGSVTGAPKIRAMQVIDELEPFARGAYCGAIGFLSDCGLLRLSVAIRTATIEGVATTGDIDRVRGELTFPVGAGIVAESDPAEEWRETLAKAASVVAALGETNP